MLRTLSAWLLAGLVLASPSFSQIIVDLRPDPDAGRPRPPRLVRHMPLVIERHAVTVRIEDGVARTTVKQTFRNPNHVVLEGTYVFPLAEDAAISNFAMLMGGKMVSGEVLEKGKAAQIYRDIVARSMDPALLEYVGRRLFQVHVFPIPASGTTDIEMTFSETLTRSASLLEYRYPFRTQGVSPHPVGEAVVTVDIVSKTPMRAIYSPTHTVDVVKKGDFEARASFEQKGYAADRDFVLALGLGSDPIGATLLSHVEGNGEGAFVLVLSPSIEVKAAKTVAKDVIFVADTSGSMAGDKINQLKGALAYCLKSLNAADRFGLMTFASDPKLFSETLRAVEKPAIEDALRYVSELKAAGGTNIHDALTQALALAGEGSERPASVIFLTDGRPTVGNTNTDTILKAVRDQNKGRARVFVFGIGSDLDPVLLDRVAEENRGSRDYVDDRENIEVKVSGFYEKIAHPVLSNTKVTFEGVAIDDVYPKTLPDLFRGSQILLTGRFKGEGEVKVHLSGTVDGAQVAHTFPLRIGGASQTPSLPRLWAVRKVGFMLDQIRMNGEHKELKDEIVRLGVKYGIVTPYTSFLVVEDAVAGGPGGGGGPGGAGQPRLRETGRAAPGPTGFTGPGAARLGGRAPGARPPAPAQDDAESTKAEPSYDRDVVEAGVELKDKFFSDSVTLSKHIKQLRETQAGGGSLGSLIKAVGDRTFVARDGLYVESAILALDPQKLGTIKQVEAYSDEYFALLQRAPELGPVLALGENVLFMMDGGTLVQIIPRAAESQPAEGAESR